MKHSHFNKKQLIQAILAAAVVMPAAADPTYFLMAGQLQATPSGLWESINLSLQPLPSVNGEVDHPLRIDLRPYVVIDGDLYLNEAAVSWSILNGSLPAGLKLANGVLSGTPTEKANKTLTVKAQYKNKSTTAPLEISTNLDITLASNALTAQLRTPLSAISLNDWLSAQGKPVNPSHVAWEAVSLPEGLSLSPTGLLTGTPNEMANSIEVRATYKNASIQGHIPLNMSVGVALTEGVRTWADGSIAKSCKDYIQPNASHLVYAGDTGSGAYKIQPTGWAPISVYCEMDTDGGGWTIAAYKNGELAASATPQDFFVSTVRSDIAYNKDMPSAAMSLNIESLASAIGARDIMAAIPAISSTNIIEKGTGPWNYNAPDCSGPIGHSGRNSGCPNHHANDNWDLDDRFNIAIYGYLTNFAIVPYHLHRGGPLCYPGIGSCSFHIYVR